MTVQQIYIEWEHASNLPTDQKIKKQLELKAELKKIMHPSFRCSEDESFKIKPKVVAMA